MSVRRGVYINHAGPLTWTQRAWCTLVDTAPSVLSHESALTAATGGSDPGPIHIAVDLRRNVAHRSGIIVHYRADLDSITLDASPPRTH